ncbi:hypothetical protein CHELA17_63726 [Chelatococcus asaccharovorans]|nr:hypothetical protein CHELA17_63726 [Chelatococcus asaccharovorans]
MNYQKIGRADDAALTADIIEWATRYGLRERSSPEPRLSACAQLRPFF